MFQKGSLLWIPQGTIMMRVDPNNPVSVCIVDKPKVGLYLESHEADETWAVILSNGSRWFIGQKDLRHLRRKDAS